MPQVLWNYCQNEDIETHCIKDGGIAAEVFAAISQSTATPLAFDAAGSDNLLLMLLSQMIEIIIYDKEDLDAVELQTMKNTNFLSS